jgi:hypothetical protein
MVIMTTIGTHLCPLAWKHLSMTVRTCTGHLRKTAAKHLSLAPHWNTIDVGIFWSTSTRATWISGVMFFKHKYITNPSVTPEDSVIAVAQALAQALNNRLLPHIHTSTM